MSVHNWRKSCTRKTFFFWCEPALDSLHWAALKKKSNSMKNGSSFWWFFPAEYEFSSHFFTARPDRSNFFYKSKNHPKLLFLATVNAEDDKQFHRYVCVKHFQRIIINAYIQIRDSNTNICEKLFKSFLEPKRTQVSPLKLQYQKALDIFF